MAKKKKSHPKKTAKKAKKALKKAKKGVHKAVASGGLTPSKAASDIHGILTKLPGLTPLEADARVHIAKPHGDADRVIEKAELLLEENHETLKAIGVEPGEMSAKWAHAK